MNSGNVNVEGLYPTSNRTIGLFESMLPEDHYWRRWDAYNDSPLYVRPWNWVVPIASTILYLIMVFYLPPLIKKPFNLKWPLAFWNLFLCLLSAFMFIPWIEAMFSEFRAHNYSVHHIICLPRGELRAGLGIWMASLFGYSKIIEFGDTLFLILRGKEVNFLHWYHHSSVLLYAWFNIITLFPVANIFATVNCFVHTIMYGYFFLSALGSRPWWGRYVTRIQIIQMLIGLASVSIWSYYYLTGQNCNLWVNNYPGLYIPEASEKAMIISSIIVYGSYFYLFMAFYLRRFSEESPAPRARRGEKTKKNE
eukprot:TRINITY_DN4220_c0_g1_i1.p1 TRINITY_DN4220_c0_g1~~TRINITY_DN4220_c0_g1_i1.p1  ORF type:complete len:308 (+),score=19.89 TRINITY_DN4220_c0_g1_i1:206-1129(+)